MTSTGWSVKNGTSNRCVLRRMHNGNGIYPPDIEIGGDSRVFSCRRIIRSSVSGSRPFRRAIVATDMAPFLTRIWSAWASFKRSRTASVGGMPRISTAVRASDGNGRQSTAWPKTSPQQLEVVVEHLVLQPVEHLHRRPFGHHRRRVVRVLGVGGQHELGHHQPAGDGPQLGLQHGHVAAGVDARGGKLVVGAGDRVEDRAGRVAAEMAGSARWPALATRQSRPGRRRIAPARRRWRRCACGSRRSPIGFRPRRSCCAAAFRRGGGSCARERTAAARASRWRRRSPCGVGFRPRQPVGRRSNSPARSPRRPGRSGCRSWPRGRQSVPSGAATWAGSTNRTRIVPSRPGRGA